MPPETHMLSFISYPVISVVCILPFSITRQMTFDGHPPPLEASGFTSVIFYLSGFFNVLLFFFTRPQLIRGSSSTEDVNVMEAEPTLNEPQHPYGHLGHVSREKSSVRISGCEDNVSLAVPTYNYHARDGQRYRAERESGVGEADLNGLSYHPYEKSLSGSSSTQFQRLRYSESLRHDEDMDSLGRLPR